MVPFVVISALFASAISAFAVPTLELNGVDLRERTIVSRCKTVSKGILKTSLIPASNAPHLHFVKNELTFGGDLTAEFRSCQPNFGGFNGTAYDQELTGGHIYIPSTGLCLTAKDIKSGPPFIFEEATCLYIDDRRQIAQNFVQQSDGIIYYSGSTQANGSHYFWGKECSLGQFGVNRNQKTGTAKLQCTNLQSTIGLRAGAVGRNPG